MSKLKLYLLVFVFLIMFFGNAFISFCSESSDKPENALVISLPVQFSPFMFLNAENNPSGMLVDFWRLWAQKTNKTIEFLPADSWKQSVENVITGKAAIHGGLFDDPETYQDVIFSQPIYEAGVSIFYPLSTGKMSSISDFFGKPIGAIRGSVQERYLNQHYPNIAVVEFDSREKMMFAARDGHISGFIAVWATASSDIFRLGLTGEFECLPNHLYTGKISIGTRKDHTDILSMVDKGIDLISDQELADIEKRWIPDPDQRYFPQKAKKIRLTSDQQKWIETHPVIKIGLFDSIEPAMFIGENNTFQGIIKELMDIVSLRTGIQFEIVPISIQKRNQVVSFVKEGIIDGFPGFETPERRELLMFSDPLYSFSWVIVVRNEMPFISGYHDLKQMNLKVALLSGHFKQSEKYSEIETITAASTSDALRLVSSGKADAAVVGLDVAACQIRNLKLHNLKVAAPAGYPDSVTKFAIRKEYSDLIPILNKAISTIDQKERDDIIHKWLPIHFEQVSDWSKAVKWGLGIGSILMVILMVSLFWNRRLSKEVTERRQVEQKLKENQILLNNTGEMAKVGGWELDADTLEVHWTEATYRIHEVPLDYKPPLQDAINFYHPESRDILKEAVKRALESGVPYDLELRFITAKGKELWTRAICHPQIADGKIVKLTGTFQDITDRKLAEIALKESEEQFRFMFENHHAIMLLVDPETETIIRANQAAQQFYGYQKNEFENLSVDQINLLPKDQIREEIEKAKTNQVNRFHFSHRLADGEIRQVEVHSSPITMKGKTFLFSIIHDITDRRQIEDKLRASEHKYRIIADNIPGVVYQLILHPDGSFSIPYVNDRIFEYLGISAQEIMSNPQLLFMTILPSDKERIQNALYESAKTLKPYSIEHSIIDKNGQLRWFQVESNPQKLPNGDIVWNGVSFDITERKQAEEEIRKAKDIAEAATRAKSDFLANMSHEIRTPMNVIVGMSDLIRKTSLTPRQKEYTDMIYDSSQLLLSVIEDILDFSKIESGKIELESISFDLQKLLTQTTEMLKLKASEKNLLMTCTIDEQIPRFLKGDVNRLRQVILNLVNNAVKFTEKGEIHLNIIPDSETDSQILLRFIVSDTGVGIPEDRLNRLFKPFSQADASTTRKYGGTGLGLAISSRIVALMGGKMTVQSAVGKGTTFQFTVWLEKSKDRLDKVCHIKETMPISSDQLSGHRILLAEDNPFNQKMTLIILDQIGICADVASNGKEAVEAVRKGNYDLVLMDIQMPVMDGLEAAKMIRSDGNQIPIIALTANTTSEYRTKCQHAGMNDFLSKPIHTEKLIQAVSKQLHAVISTPAKKHQEEPQSQDIIFDKTSYLERLGGDEDIGRELLSLFLEELPVRLQEIQTAIQAEDTDAVAAHAHKLKGTSGNISAIRLYDVACELVNCGRQHDMKKIKEMVTVLEAECGRLKEVLEIS